MNVLNQTLEYYHENDLFMNVFIIISILIPMTLCLLCMLNLNIFLLILGESYIISLDDEYKKRTHLQRNIIYLISDIFTYYVK